MTDKEHRLHNLHLDGTLSGEVIFYCDDMTFDLWPSYWNVAEISLVYTSVVIFKKLGQQVQR